MLIFLLLYSITRRSWPSLDEDVLRFDDGSLLSFGLSAEIQIVLR